MKRGIVVYGSGPQDSYNPTLVGRLNIEAALKIFFQQKKKATFILTGGKSGKSSFSEAEVMAAELVWSGIPEKRILLEKEATNTIENVVLVTNLVDRMDFEYLFHVAPQVQLPRIKELCYLVGIHQLSKYKSSEKILGGDGLPIIEAARKSLQMIATNEPRWKKGLQKVPLYWLPQVAQLNSISRWRHVLCRPRLLRFLEERFGITEPAENLTEAQLKDLKETIRKEKRIMPKREDK